MNSHQSSADRAHLEAARTPLVAALETLFEDGRWTSVPSPGGATLTRCWDDESTDTLVIVNLHTAYAWRENPHGRETIRIADDAEKIITAVSAWLDPAELGAPDGSGHIPSPSGAWT